MEALFFPRQESFFRRWRAARQVNPRRVGVEGEEAAAILIEGGYRHGWSHDTTRYGPWRGMGWLCLMPHEIWMAPCLTSASGAVGSSMARHNRRAPMSRALQDDVILEVGQRAWGDDHVEDRDTLIHVAECSAIVGAILETHWRDGSSVASVLSSSFGCKRQMYMYSKSGRWSKCFGTGQHAGIRVQTIAYVIPRQATGIAGTRPVWLLQQIASRRLGHGALTRSHILGRRGPSRSPPTLRSELFLQASLLLVFCRSDCATRVGPKEREPRSRRAVNRPRFTSGIRPVALASASGGRFRHQIGVRLQRTSRLDIALPLALHHQLFFLHFFLNFHRPQSLRLSLATIDEASTHHNVRSQGGDSRTFTIQRGNQGRCQGSLKIFTAVASRAGRRRSRRTLRRRCRPPF